jgi:arylsulfatase A-like enzyme
MRTDRYRFTKWRKKAQPHEVVNYELYDLKTDPDGLVNIANDPASENILRELSKLMIDAGIGEQVIQ